KAILKTIGFKLAEKFVAIKQILKLFVFATILIACSIIRLLSVMPVGVAGINIKKSNTKKIPTDASLYQKTVYGLSEQIQELSRKVTELEIEVAALKKIRY
ncbi:hypothetical protein ALC62_03436, partial [Cyphomyrmex costatus]